VEAELVRAEFARAELKRTELVRTELMILYMAKVLLVFLQAIVDLYILKVL
jgi:hypothetical protein